MSQAKISASTATLFCLNTMIGAGLFINPAPLAFKAGPFGFLGYVAAALVLLPTVLCISELAKLHPVSGGLYVYSQQYLGKRIGFVAAWSFFLAKTVSPMLILHKIVGYFHARVPFLQPYTHLTVDYVSLMLLLGLIIAGVKIGGRAQYFFISLKSIPLFFVFFMAAQIISPEPYKEAITLFSTTTILDILPISIFALTGFEIICGIGGLIENPERNIRKAILTAFFIVITIATLFQLFLYGAMGDRLGIATEPVLSLAGLALPTYPLLGSVINAFVFASMLGGVFSMFASTCWYIHTFGTAGHFPLGNILSKINQHHVPWVGLLLQGLLAITLITITQEQVALQTMSTFALITCFAITICAALKARLNKVMINMPLFLPIIAIIFSSYVITLCLKNIQKAGVSFSFLSIFFAGIILELITKQAKK